MCATLLATGVGACGGDDDASEDDGASEDTIVELEDATDDDSGGSDSDSGEGDDSGEEETSDTVDDGPQLGVPIDATPGVTLTFDNPTAESGPGGRWLEVDITVDNSFMSPHNLNVGLVCSVVFEPGPILPSDTVVGGTPYPVEQEVPADTVVEGRLALGLPVTNDGEPVDSCDGVTAIQVFDGFQEQVALPEDVQAELYG